MIEWFKYLFDAISHCAARLAVPDVKFPSKIMPFPVQTQSFFAWSYNTYVPNQLDYCLDKIIKQILLE